MASRSSTPTLDDALIRLAGTFRGMTAHADEIQCECHWGSAEELASLFARARWQQWPVEQADAITGFLHAWWAHCLNATLAPAAHEVFAFCTEAAGTVTPWLATWDATRQPLADQRLADAVDHWASYLLEDQLPWDTWDREQEKRHDLTTWLLQHAPSRLGEHHNPAHILRLLALPTPTRFYDPHWPYPTHRNGARPPW